MVNFPYLEAKVKHWFGFPAQGRGRRRSHRAKVLDTNPGSVIEYVLGLPDEPTTATHIVMATYQTMRVRGLRMTQDMPKHQLWKLTRVTRRNKRKTDGGLGLLDEVGSRLKQE